MAAGMVQVQSLRGFRELVADLGGEPTRLLRRMGVDPSVLDQLTGFITFEQQAALLELAADELRGPDFGLRLADRQDIGILGILAVAMRYSATVGEALRCAGKYLHAYNTAVDLTVTTGASDAQVRVVFSLPAGSSLRLAQVTEHGIALTWRIITMLSEARSQLNAVCFPHAALTNEADYRTRFPGAITFHADEAALVVDTKGLTLPISENIAELHDLATRYLDRRLPREPTTLTAQVRHAIEALLGTGTCTQPAVAAALYIHPRTLQRRLHDDGFSFEAIKDETRKELAERYLSQSEVSFSQIAALLDYSEQSAFGRSCRRWFNASPQQVRNSLAT
jgi:AraC-like DNA-binding protein